MLLDFSPLLKYRDYRLLLIGQTVSFLGTMITYMATPWQVYDLTHSTFLVGLLGAVELVPMVLFGLLGGSVADSMDRKRLLWVSECVMAVGSLSLAVNAWLPNPSVAFIFVAAAIMQAANGFHRPAMEAAVQKIVQPEDYASVGAISMLRYSIGAIIGPAIGGIIIAAGGVSFAYGLDAVSFVAAIASVLMMRTVPPAETSKGNHRGKVIEGLRYAFSRQDLLGTYFVDIIAMTFALPVALFPALGEQWGGAKMTGFLFSSMATGSLISTLLSGWTSKVRAHGKGVVFAAAAWGVAIIGLGLAPNAYVGMVCLALAGAADTVSGIFRQVIWNETIPNEKRGRLASIEMISYMSGPLLGNTRAGWVASVTNPMFSVFSGGVVCVLGVLGCRYFFPEFWRYRSERE